jgi:hypothetical protein
VALYDQRVFKHDDKWWAAEVHSGVGGGFVPRPQITRERVYFTCLSDENRPTVTGTIPAGWLNTLSHGSVVGLLENAKPLDTRFDMHPYNAPDREEYRGLEVIYDDENLRWVIVRTEVLRVGLQRPERIPAIRLICLDDSALRNDVLLNSSQTYDDLVTTWGGAGKYAIISSVKQGFRDLKTED